MCPVQYIGLVKLNVRTRGKSNSSVMIQLVFSATVYHIWTERNGRVFQQKNKSVEAVILGIVADIRACLMGWKQVPNFAENKSLRRVWGMPQRWCCS